MTTSTPGRMPAIAFSDDADYDTLRSVLNTDGMPFSNGEPSHGWCVGLRRRNGEYTEVALFDSPEDSIGGKTWNGTDWNGPEFYVPLDDVVQIIVL
jgi:hypothetical protein